MQKILFLAIATFLYNAVSAQTTVQYEKYMRKAGKNAFIYSGKEAFKYDLLFEGTFYAYSAAYLRGDVNYAGKDYYGLLLNIDANLDELEVMACDDADDIHTLSKDLVSSFSIGGRQYTNIRQSNAIMPAGYYEIIYSSKDNVLYKKIIKHYIEEILMDGGYQVLRHFEVKVKYFLVNSNGSYEIRNKGNLLSKFRDKRKAVTMYLKRIPHPHSDLYSVDEITFQMMLDAIDTKLK